MQQTKTFLHWKSRMACFDLKMSDLSDLNMGFIDFSLGASAKSEIYSNIFC